MSVDLLSVTTDGSSSYINDGPPIVIFGRGAPTTIEEERAAAMARRAESCMLN